MRHRNKRLLSATFTLFAVGATALAVEYVRAHLGDESTLTGWVLLSATATLYLLPIRKGLIASRLGPVSAWLQVHAYTGTFASVVFLMHIGWPVRGLFELALAGVFTFVAVTGALLGYLSRTTPRRLGAIDRENRMERIPGLQAAVAYDAHQAAIASSQHGEGATLAEYYQRRLLPFFQSRRGPLYSVMPNGVRRRRLVRELVDLDRYLAENGVQCRQSLSRMVVEKDDLDYQYALQSRLRWFYLMHVLLTWSLALMIVVHVVLVYRFQGAML